MVFSLNLLVSQPPVTRQGSRRLSSSARWKGEACTGVRADTTDMDWSCPGLVDESGLSFGEGALPATFVLPLPVAKQPPSAKQPHAFGRPQADRWATREQALAIDHN
jgi:hypothetical protein